VAADVGEEQLQAVGGAGDRLRRLEPRGLRLLLGGFLGVGGSGGLGLSRGRADLEPDPLELVRQLLDLLVVQIELDGERLQLGGLQVAAFLRALDECARLVGLEQLVQLVLAQVSSVLSGPCVDCDSGPSHSTREVLSLPGVPSAPAVTDFRTGARLALFRRCGLGLGLFRLRPDGEVEFDLSLVI
jgi:hypothetical protein